jgi:hypothetical protein
MVTLVNVGIGVRVGKRNITVAVSVGMGVSVLRGVGVRVAVAVDVGNAAAVLVEAASEVCTMNVLAAPGTGVETCGAAKVGTQAKTTLRAINQASIFVLRVDISPPYLAQNSKLQRFHYLSTMMATYGKQSWPSTR